MRARFYVKESTGNATESHHLPFTLMQLHHIARNAICTPKSELAF